MIRVRENMDIVVLYSSHVELVEQDKAVLHMHVVVGDAVHDEEADVLAESGYIVDAGVVVAGAVVLWRVHVALGVDRVWCAMID